jgi:hypothetical protein
LPELDVPHVVVRPAAPAQEDVVRPGLQDGGQSRLERGGEAGFVIIQSVVVVVVIPADAVLVVVRRGRIVPNALGFASPRRIHRPPHPGQVRVRVLVLLLQLLLLEGVVEVGVVVMMIRWRLDDGRRNSAGEVVVLVARMHGDREI